MAVKSIYRWRWRVRITDETAMILPTTLIFMGVLVLLGTTAFVMTTTEMKIGKNHKVSEQAFYGAVAGCEEARARLADGAGTPVTDTDPHETSWRTYIGSVQHAVKYGFDPADSLHHRYDSLADALVYTVIIRHSGGSAGPRYWGDITGDGLPQRNGVAGKNIYDVTTHVSLQGSARTVQTEIAEIPPISVSAALYVESATAIQGAATHIVGINGCTGSDKKGIVTAQSAGSVSVSGGAQVTGSGGAVPDISYNGTNMDVEGIVGFYAEHADFRYCGVGVTHGSASIPGPGDGWGTPSPGTTLQDASSCAASIILYYDTAATYLKLSAGVHGCGMLLVDGDLEISGDFFWYGPVIVTGSVVFSGGGNRNITGALVCGGSVVCDVSGGDSNIIYCRDAVKAPTEGRPLECLSWKEGS